MLNRVSGVGIALVAGLIAALCASGQSFSAAQPKTYPPVKLRGYGTLSGTFLPTQIDQQPASTLRIECEDDDKAKLVHAKYLSDLGVLPGVKAITISAPDGTLPAYEVENQGAILAARSRKTVFVLTAASTKALSQLESQVLKPLRAHLVFAPEAPVPMYLDRWDKYGFRFYYGPFARPKGPDGRSVRSYDPVQDFDFAERQGHAGIVFWAICHPAESAEGMLNTNTWKWVLDEAKARRLPVGVNDEISNKAEWAVNRYAAETIQRQPQYLGSWYGAMNFGFTSDILSWNATEAKDQILAEFQQAIRKLTLYENITSWLEPHAEMGHGAADVFVDYGPTADRGYREFLRQRYGSLKAVSRRWHSNLTALRSWDDVHVPELASFLGWGPGAIDLTGTWRISYDAVYDPASAALSTDDSSWPTVPAPGHAIVTRLPRKPAIFRRHVALSKPWLAAHRRVWLYVWDLNDTRVRKDGIPSEFQVYVNGKSIPENPPRRLESHWVGLEVTAAVTAGDNLIAVALPQGMFDYRVYLSPEEPRAYPELGEHMNARWADFSDWNAWMRGLAVRRGAEMIRQVDPNRPIVLMSPDYYLGPIKAVAEDFGGVFHNTGYMAGGWADLHSMAMESSGLATDVEPGSGAKDIDEFKKFLGLWSTEGIQGIDYFGHLGDILWNPEIKEHFEKTINLWRLIGKYHVPKAEVAILHSDRNVRLNRFPWNSGWKAESTNTLVAGGYWGCRLGDLLLNEVARETIVEPDFARGTADQYRVIIDGNTSILDNETIDQIERWVRAGGIFVTYLQTGRHTSSKMNAWPISRLSGYATTAVDEIDSQGEYLHPRKMHLAPGQRVFKGEGPEWTDLKGAGLSLRRQAPGCEDLARWEDGSVAIGMRRLGKGVVIELGARFNDAEMFRQILRWAKVKPLPFSAENVVARHFVSNNGLYDVWVLWNKTKEPVTTDLKFRNGVRPAFAIDVNSGVPIKIQRDGEGAKIAGLKLGPLETQALLTPRGEFSSAATEWFVLQRNWWKGTHATGTPIPALHPKFTLDLTSDWAFKPLDENQVDVSALADPRTDDSSWSRRDLGMLELRGTPQIRHSLFRRKFAVPGNWSQGRVLLWVRSSGSSTFWDTGRVFLDGKVIQEPSTEGVMGSDVGGALKPGSTHILAVEVTAKSSLAGIAGNAWLAYHPAPDSQKELGGEWEVSADALRFTTHAALPGNLDGVIARRMVKIDASVASKTVVFHAKSNKSSIRGVIVNGRSVSPFDGRLGPELNLNITPWVKFGSENEFLVLVDGKCLVEDLTLQFHKKGTYP